MLTAITPEKCAAQDPQGPTRWSSGKAGESIPMLRKTIAKALTWRLIGTAEIFAISFWTTGHMATAGHTAGIAAISSVIMYVAHELAWRRASLGCRGSRTSVSDI